ncbi:MAG: VanZ family protein [Methylococcaceae bacterium]|nr:VanZ family protein [Methylococcaceae bacterium]
MKSLFFVTTSIILFFAFSPANYTPSIVGAHDKVAHFVAFFCLALGLNFSFPLCSIKRAFLILVLLAAGIEIIQFYFTNRQLSILDFSAGLAGVLFYLSMYKIINRINTNLAIVSKIA